MKLHKHKGIDFEVSTAHTMHCYEEALQMAVSKSVIHRGKKYKIEVFARSKQAASWWDRFFGSGQVSRFIAHPDEPIDTITVSATADLMPVQAYHYGRWGSATPQESCVQSANGGLVFFGDRRTQAVTDPFGRTIGFVNTTRTSSTSSPSSPRTRRDG